MTQQVIQQIYQHCEQLSPYLKAIATADVQSDAMPIRVNDSNLEVIKSLHHHLQLGYVRRDVALLKSICLGDHRSIS